MKWNENSLKTFRIFCLFCTLFTKKKKTKSTTNCKTVEFHQNNVYLVQPDSELPKQAVLLPAAY